MDQILPRGASSCSPLTTLSKVLRKSADHLDLLALGEEGQIFLAFLLIFPYNFFGVQIKKIQNHMAEFVIGVLWHVWNKSLEHVHQMVLENQFNKAFFFIVIFVYYLVYYDA